MAFLSEEGILLCVCISAYDSKFDNVLLLLACSVYDVDHNPSDGQMSNPPRSAERSRSISVRLRLQDRMERSYVSVTCYILLESDSTEIAE